MANGQLVALDSKPLKISGMSQTSKCSDQFFCDVLEKKKYIYNNNEKIMRKVRYWSVTTKSHSNYKVGFTLNCCLIELTSCIQLCINRLEHTEGFFVI